MNEYRMSCSFMPSLIFVTNHNSIMNEIFMKQAWTDSSHQQNELAYESCNSGCSHHHSLHVLHVGTSYATTLLHLRSCCLVLHRYSRKLENHLPIPLRVGLKFWQPLNI